MNFLRVLRVLIALEALAVFIVVGLDSTLEHALGPQLQSFLEEERARAWSTMEWIVATLGIPLIVGIVAGWIGLWLLKPWSRALYTACWLSAVVLVAFSGAIVMHPIAYAVNEAASALGGMILGVIWFSELASRFRKPDVHVRP